MAFLGDIGQALGILGPQIARGYAGGQQNAMARLAQMRQQKALQDFRNQQLQLQQQQMQGQQEDRSQRASFERAKPFMEFWGDQDRVYQAQQDGSLGQWIDASENAFKAAGLDLDVGKYRPQPALAEPFNAPQAPQLETPGVMPQMGMPGPGMPGMGQLQMPPGAANLQTGAPEPAPQPQMEMRSPVQFQPSAKTQQGQQRADTAAEIAELRKKATDADVELKRQRALTDELTRDPRIAKIIAEGKSIRAGIPGKQYEPKYKAGMLEVAQKGVGIRGRQADTAEARRKDTAKYQTGLLGESAANRASREKIANAAAAIRRDLVALAQARNPAMIENLRSQIGARAAILDPSNKLGLAARFRAATMMQRTAAGGTEPLDPEAYAAMLANVDEVEAAAAGTAPPAAAAPSAPAAPTAPSPGKFSPAQVNAVSRALNAGTFASELAGMDPASQVQANAIRDFIMKSRSTKKPTKAKAGKRW
jgi:hypothetical protein